MMGHKICFYGEVWIVIPKLSLLPLLIWCTGISACSLCHVLSHFNKFLSSANKYLFEKKMKPNVITCMFTQMYHNLSQCYQAKIMLLLLHQRILNYIIIITKSDIKVFVKTTNMHNIKHSVLHVLFWCMHYAICISFMCQSRNC